MCAAAFARCGVEIIMRPRWCGSSSSWFLAKVETPGARPAYDCPVAESALNEDHGSEVSRLERRGNILNVDFFAIQLASSRSIRGNYGIKSPPTQCHSRRRRRG